MELAFQNRHADPSCLTESYGESVAEGDLSLLDVNWNVTHAGLLRLAVRRCCVATSVSPVREFRNPRAGRWPFKVNKYKTSRSKSSCGCGAGDP